MRDSLGDAHAPDFAGRIAWRALVPADAVAAEFRAPDVHLWLGQGGHLVHYPVEAGATDQHRRDRRRRLAEPGWSTAADRDEVLARFPPQLWAAPARELLAAPERWLKWALYDRAPSAGTGAAGR